MVKILKSAIILAIMFWSLCMNAQDEMYIVVPGDCSEFVVLLLDFSEPEIGMFAIGECQIGSVFDFDTYGCNWPSNVDCAGEGRTYYPYSPLISTYGDGDGTYWCPVSYGGPDVNYETGAPGPAGESGLANTICGCIP